jgi:hypothetical protein
MAFKVQVGPGQIAIHQGQTVLVTEPDGQVNWPSERGLYFRDTRVISAWAMCRRIGACDHNSEQVAAQDSGRPCLRLSCRRSGAGQCEDRVVERRSNLTGGAAGKVVAKLVTGECNEN